MVILIAMVIQNSNPNMLWKKGGRVNIADDFSVVCGELNITKTYTVDFDMNQSMGEMMTVMMSVMKGGRD